MKTLNFFKRFVGSAMILLAMATPMFTSCYDDSALNEQIEELQKEVDQIKSDLAALKAAVDSELSVLELNQIEGGYELVMSDGSKINIYNGENGEKGDKGDTGASGITGPKGDAFFKSVKISDDGLYVIITLTDNSQYTLAMGGFNIVFSVSGADALMIPGEAVKVPYTIVGAAESDEVVVRILNSSNCAAEVLAEENAVSVTPGKGTGYVDLYALNNTTGDLKARTITFNGYTFDVSETEFLAAPWGGTVEVPVTTSVDYDVEIDAAWLAYTEVKSERSETLVLTATAENVSGVENTAKVTIKEKETAKVLSTFKVTQKSYVKELLGEYLESYSQYGQQFTGTMKIEKSDDSSKGVYKVTICGTTLYADYADGVLSCYDGKNSRNLTVAEDYSRFEIANLDLNYTTYSDYVAILPLGPAELTEAEAALVGTYNEAWTHDGGAVPAENGMIISASDEASYGTFKVKCMVTNDGSYYEGYTSLVDSKLTINIGNQNHSKFGMKYDPAATIEFTVNSDGTISFSSWKDAKYDTVSDYVATKVVEGGDGGNEDVSSPFIGEYAESWEFYDDISKSWTSSIGTVKISTNEDDNGAFLVEMFTGLYGGMPGGKYYFNLKENTTDVLVFVDVKVQHYYVEPSGMELTLKNGVLTITAGLPSNVQNYTATRK